MIERLDAARMFLAGMALLLIGMVVHAYISNLASLEKYDELVEECDSYIRACMTRPPVCGAD